MTTLSILLPLPVSDEERQELVEVLKAIIVTMPFNEEMLSKVVQTECKGHPIYGDPNLGSLEEQMVEAYQTDLLEKIDHLKEATSKISASEGTYNIVADLEVERQIRRLRELRTWVQLSTEINLSDK